MQVYNDEVLYHHGKLGMKWGHRNGVTKNNKQSTTPKLKFKNHKIGKSTITALTQIGLMTATSIALGKHTSLGPGSRYVSSLLVGGLGANKMANILRDK